MNTLMKLAVLSLGIVVPFTAPAAASAQDQSQSAQQIVDELLATDRAFAAAAADRDTVTALSAMFHPDVIMPLPTGTFARGRDSAVEALRANPFNTASRAEWTPIRGGVSADGQHGFTLGYMTLRGNDGSTRLAKYLTYWVRTPEGWRAAAFKRAPRPEGDVSLDLMPASLPARLVAPTRDEAPAAALRQGLMAAEQAFSDEAQRIGLGPAFRRNGRDDAVNVGGEASFAVGAANISRFVGGDSTEASVNWGADDALVASSGDLGVTFGLIRPNGPEPEGRPPASPFFTIWRRDSVNDRWLYIAE
jgi:ketosteroid isomerase-like protein